MSGNMNEYVFCPYCGGITPPGTCVNCGMSTVGEKKPESQPAANTSAPITLEKKENNLPKEAKKPLVSIDKSACKGYSI